MNYEQVIGLEVHLQPTTKSKMFCSCSTDYFGKAPNSLTCPVCLGLPGALPVPNKQAILKCLKLGLALNCKLNRQSKFDRKNYFYPDLPKGYQISQYDLPFCYEGFVEVDTAKDTNRIRITRIHLEEDTAKSIHTDTETLIDFNKSGMPLIELVTEPDFRDVKEVLIFAKRLRQIVRYLGISQANMEKGQMRFELNMSLKESGSKGLPNYKIEVKNIGSISVLEKVIKFEYERQSQILESGKTPEQETRGLRDLTGTTYGQRKKEGSADYRYFPEPDIPPIEVTDDMITLVKSELIELPHRKKMRYIDTYRLEPSTAETLVDSVARADWFERGIDSFDNDKDLIAEFAKWFIRDVLNLTKVHKIKLKELKFGPQDLAELVGNVKTGKLSGSLAKQVLEQMFLTGEKVENIIAEKGFSVVNDEQELAEIINQVLVENAKVVKDIAKNPNAEKFLLGQVMRLTKGKANPQTAAKLLSQVLAS